MTTQNKLQSLLITHLLKHGSVNLTLPDGVILEIGVNQVADDGELVNVPDYCWVMATRKDRMVVMDSYNVGLRFADNKSTLVFEDSFITNEGEAVRRLDVV
jgi:hypothetical protein